MIFKHISVLKKEAIAFLNINPNGLYVDATLGQGGHSLEIIKYLKNGFLYSFDQDLTACKQAYKNISPHFPINIIHSNFSYLKDKLAEKNVFQIDGILLDLGLSSCQIDNPQRGFSYLYDVPLDMRMNQQQKLTAKDIVNNYSFQKLKNIFWFYGEEPKASYIAKEIIKRRPLHTSYDVVAITDLFYRYHKGHSAKKIFQALRIEVNQELESLKKVLTQSLDLLKKHGRIVVISFHSLEDRIVKRFFKKNSIVDLPQKLPIVNFPCSPLKLITKKVFVPSQNEMQQNPRSISAKLRVAEKTFNILED
ncbi:16S rRNA (cytosine(1402)-N(4))-methyltransferase RsmH [Candidatus Phytoplasma meliae]|uniref:Ribosomal RNA small subunit methyltransferase H n=1 Tax=Candidatus Phytoplasma meliae TaxID=1848402 RepID=A0ABS5CYX6_9MOLU|nr:16S rRNA (cytosine(1402)-N(4))-methyltransferase RsmH [Candidatus Phytoplasma meliae]MBP5835806.1 16S rRNA (cytosine(1402)-N(4))-methyltransferase RsmH [Candidatus Phytoplasma meliae]MBP5836183.1 16S rRNA (cytosine(1402)-N(4))-methyltransferase RsmH [Candidatus Phytoplasma meliae]